MTIEVIAVNLIGLALATAAASALFVVWDALSPEPTVTQAGWARRMIARAEQLSRAARNTRTLNRIKDARKAIKRRLNLYKYRGDQFSCPVCNASLGGFAPIWKSFPRKLAEFGYVYPISSIETLNVSNYSCPACGASDRERLSALFFRKFCKQRPATEKLVLLEFAPSPSFQNFLKCQPSIDYVSADLFRKNVDYQLDIGNMHQLADNALDIVVCSHVLEHVEDDRSAIRELYRVLSPGGFAVLLVPLITGLDETQEDPAVNTPELRWKYYGMPDHVRQYGKADFINRLTSAGFVVEQVTEGALGAGTFTRHGIAPNSCLYIGHKPA